MVVLITGASHTGKTLLAQKILEKYKYPYFSIDHLKMGLIRSGNTDLTPEDDRELETYLWPIVREMIKTAVENKQNLVVEGGYIPFTWAQDLGSEYAAQIKYCCLIMSREYIAEHFADIRQYACAAEQRKDDSRCTAETVQAENAYYLDGCRKHNCRYIWIDKAYRVDAELIMEQPRAAQGITPAQGRPQPR